jgi:hypothetical protein
MSVIPTKIFWPPDFRAEGATGLGSGAFLLKKGSHFIQ